MGNALFGPNVGQVATGITNALKDPSYQQSWADIENKISYYSTCNVPQNEIQALQKENDSRLLRQIKSLTRLGDAFWELLKENDHITMSGSYPFAVAHDLLKEKAWLHADIDIFVSLSIPIQQIGTNTINTFEQKNQRGKDISLRIWQILGIQAYEYGNESKETKESKDASFKQKIMFSIQSDPQYANSDLKREFVCSSKAKHPLTGRTINVIVLDLKDLYTNIQDALQKTFDYKVLATCVNTNSIFIPDRHDLFTKCSKFQPGIKAKERKAKYEARGITIVV